MMVVAPHTLVYCVGRFGSLSACTDGYEEAPPAERQLWIEADFLFPELSDDEDNSTVTPHFGHMRLDEVNGTTRVRFRLNAAMGLDGDIEEVMVYVLDINADGSPLTIAQVPRSERNFCSGQLNPDTWLGRSSAFAGDIPSLC